MSILSFENPVSHPSQERWLLVAESRVASVAKEVGARVELCERLEGREVEGAEWKHPLSSRLVPSLLGEHVADDVGTGVVRCLPVLL